MLQVLNPLLTTRPGSFKREGEHFESFAFEPNFKQPFPSFDSAAKTTNYDLSVPLARVDVYKNSIEFSVPFDFEENENPNNLDKKVEFPELVFTTPSRSHFDNVSPFNPIQDFIQNKNSFNLEQDAKERLIESTLFSESDKKLYRNLLNIKVRPLTSYEREASVKRYKAKKLTRKTTYQIRYKVRQDLAIKRLRNKGKFIKSKKFDYRAVANLILKGEEDQKNAAKLEEKSRFSK